jgi:peptidoglycan hydrolase-like protein with peptidoglycan-binding domain
MSRFGELYTVFHRPIGQNMDNDENDIINLKKKLNHLGRYNSPFLHGYIDADLDKSIKTYQRDRNLKADGVVLPGGET